MHRTMAWVAGIAILMAAGCSQNGETSGRQAPAEPARQTDEGTIVALGDSLTEGYGVDEADAYPARLARRLGAAGYAWRVVNAGISGETSSGALSRVDWILTLQPDIVILETGANDGMRGVDPDLTRRNIDAIVRRLREKDVTVILAGMKMFTNLGRSFTRAFEALYPSVAQDNGILLIPFFLEGVAGEPSLNLSDGIHPNAEGYRIVTDTVFPWVVRAIEQSKNR